MSMMIIVTLILVCCGGWLTYIAIQDQSPEAAAAFVTVTFYIIAIMWIIYTVHHFIAKYW